MLRKKKSFCKCRPMSTQQKGLNPHWSKFDSVKTCSEAEFELHSSCLSDFQSFERLSSKGAPPSTRSVFDRLVPSKKSIFDRLRVPQKISEREDFPVANGLARKKGPEAKGTPFVPKSTQKISHPGKRSAIHCVRCLLSGHTRLKCRNPICCHRCKNSGHISNLCKEAIGSKGFIPNLKFSSAVKEGN